MLLAPGVGVSRTASSGASAVPADLKKIIKSAGSKPALGQRLPETIASMAVSKPTDPYKFLAEALSKVAGAQ